MTDFELTLKKNFVYPEEGENIPDLEYLWELL